MSLSFYTMIGSKIKLFLVLLFCFSGSFASTNIDQLLWQTEQIGTANPRQFDENLELLNKSLPEFNQAQKDYFDYLRYYKQGYSGEFEKSLQNFTALFERSHSIDIKFRSKVKIANIHVIAGDILASLNALDYVLNTIDLLENTEIKLLGYRIAQTVYFLIEENQLSMSFSNLILENNPSDTNKCSALTNIGVLKLKMATDANTVTESLINDSIEFCESLGDFVFSNLLRLRWLKFQLNLQSATQEDYQQVLSQLNKYKTQIDETEYKNLINIKNSLFAETYRKLNDVENSLKYAHLTISGSKSIGNTAQKLSALEILVAHYKNTGQLDLAFKYLEEKVKADKIYYNQEQAKLIAYQKVKHDNQAKAQQINALNQKNQLLLLKNELSEKSKRNQLLINLLLLVVVLFFILFAVRIIRQQRKFKQLSELDHMTLIFNRKGIKEHMKILLPYAEKKNETVGYIIFDLDLFKRVNDVYGHVVGDWVIKKSIEVCKEVNNERAVFARLGGEEFSIVIRDSSLEETKRYAEIYRKAISEIKTIDATGYEFHVSASFGITTSSLSDFDYTNLMTHADHALYQSKNNGRNKSTVYQPKSLDRKYFDNTSP